MTTLKLGSKLVGLEHPTYFVADISANHDGELERAKLLIRLCAEAGANAAKFQNFRARKIVSEVGFQGLGGQLSHQSKWKKSVLQVYQEATCRGSGHRRSSRNARPAGSIIFPLLTISKRSTC